MPGSSPKTPKTPNYPDAPEFEDGWELLEVPSTNLSKTEEKVDTSKELTRLTTENTELKKIILTLKQKAKNWEERYNALAKQKTYAGVVKAQQSSAQQSSPQPNPSSFFPQKIYTPTNVKTSNKNPEHPTSTIRKRVSGKFSK